jgi:hypothetical protein
VDRHFEAARPRERSTFERRLRALRAGISQHVAAGRVALGAQAARIDLALTFDQAAGRRFFAMLARRLDRLLRVRGATVTLTIARLRGREIVHLERLLARLAQHGDRVFIRLNGSLHGLVTIDSSRFQLMLVPGAG